MQNLFLFAVVFGLGTSDISMYALMYRQHMQVFEESKIERFHAFCKFQTNDEHIINPQLGATETPWTAPTNYVWQLMYCHNVMKMDIDESQPTWFTTRLGAPKIDGVQVGHNAFLTENTNWISLNIDNVDFQFDNVAWYFFENSRSQDVIPDSVTLVSKVHTVQLQRHASLEQLASKSPLKVYSWKIVPSVYSLVIERGEFGNDKNARAFFQLQSGHNYDTFRPYLMKFKKDLPVHLSVTYHRMPVKRLTCTLLDTSGCTITDACEANEVNPSFINESKLFSITLEFKCKQYNLLDI